jgi:hypothetical protein
MIFYRKKKSVYTLSSNNRAQLRGCLRGRLRVHANARIITSCCAAGAYCDSCRASESTANRCINRRAADTYSGACCVAKPALNRRRNTYANKPIGNR